MGERKTDTWVAPKFKVNGVEYKMAKYTILVKEEMLRRYGTEKLEAMLADQGAEYDKIMMEIGHHLAGPGAVGPDGGKFETRAAFLEAFPTAEDLVKNANAMEAIGVAAAVLAAMGYASQSPWTAEEIADGRLFKKKA